MYIEPGIKNIVLNPR